MTYGASNAIDGITEGIIGIGNVLSLATNTDEVSQQDIQRIGWLLSIMGDSLQAFGSVQRTAKFYTEISKDRETHTQNQEQPA